MTVQDGRVEKPEKEDSALDKFVKFMGAISGFGAALLIPLAVAYLGNQYTAAMKNQEIQARFVELALNILKEAPAEDNHDQDIREWSVKIVENYSGVPLSADARERLIQTAPLPCRSLSFRRVSLGCLRHRALSLRSSL